MIKETERRVSTKHTGKMKFPTGMTLLPHVFPGNSILRKQISATSTWIYQFTGDKTGNRKISSLLNTLATGYGDFRTSVAKRRRRATEISVFPYRWMEEGVGFVICYHLLLYNHNISLEKICRGP